MKTFLSVVIPAFNEEPNLKKGVLTSISSYLQKQKYTWEVLIVDDGSTDRTANLVSELVRNNKNFSLLKEPHRGKGGTVIAGMLAGVGEVVLFTDMDQATPIKELEKVLPKFKKGYDVVIGSRADRSGAPFFRKLMAWGFGVLRNLILGLPFKDTQCGFKGFKKEAAKKIFKRMKIFSEGSKENKAGVTAGFDLELLYIARKLGLKVAEVPVEWTYQKSERVNLIKDSWEGLRDLVKVRINSLIGRYKV